jgi:hypothetical protein
MLASPRQQQQQQQQMLASLRQQQPAMLPQQPQQQIKDLWCSISSCLPTSEFGRTAFIWCAARIVSSSSSSSCLGGLASLLQPEILGCCC